MQFDLFKILNIILKKKNHAEHPKVWFIFHFATIFLNIKLFIMYFDGGKHFTFS
jgi:hypothetical protein